MLSTVHWHRRRYVLLRFSLRPLTRTINGAHGSVDYCTSVCGPKIKILPRKLVCLLRIESIVPRHTGHCLSQARAPVTSMCPVCDCTFHARRRCPAIPSCCCRPSLHLHLPRPQTTHTCTATVYYCAPTPSHAQLLTSTNTTLGSVPKTIHKTKWNNIPMQTTILNTKLTEVIALYRKSVAKLQKFFKSLESRVDKFALPKEQLKGKREQIRNSCSNLINGVTDVATFLGQMKHQLQAPIPQNMYVAPALRCIMFPAAEERTYHSVCKSLRIGVAREMGQLSLRLSSFCCPLSRPPPLSLSLSFCARTGVCVFWTDVGLATLQRYFGGKIYILGEIGTRSCPARCSSLKI